MNYSQTDIDNHIKDIIGADEPESVTNKIVGAILDHLNNMLKTAGESARIISITGVITPDDDNDNYKKCQDVNGIVYHESANKFADFYGISADPFDYDSITDGSFPGATKSGTPLGSVLYFVATGQGYHNAGLYKYNGKRLVNLFYIDELNDKVLGLAENVNDLMDSIKVMTFDGITDVEPEIGLPGLLQYPVGSILWIRPWRAFVEILPDNDWEHFNDNSHAEANRLYRCNNTLFIGCKNLADDNVDLVPIDGNRSVCYCTGIGGGEPPTAGAVAGTRVVVRGDKGDAVWVYVPDGVWVPDEWSCPGGRLRSDLIYAVRGGAGAPPDLYVALVKPDGNTVLNAVATEHWISRNGFYNYVEASDDIEAAEAGEPGTLRLRLTDKARRAVFNDLFDALAGESGGFLPSVAPDPALPYKLNDLWLSYSEAVAHLPYIRPLISTSIRGLFARHSCKTAVLALAGRYVNYDASMAFYQCADMQSVRLIALDGREVFFSNIDTAFAFCRKLVNIDGTINIKACTSGGANIFSQCSMLREVRLSGLNMNIVISEASDLSQASLAFLVDNAANTAVITVTLHAEAFARLTPELIAKAAEKQVTFASV